MTNVTGNLKTDTEALKKLLPAEDILTFSFQSENGTEFTAVFADALTDKELLGEQIVKPLRKYLGKTKAEEVGKGLNAPELKQEKSLEELDGEVLAGNYVLMW